MLIKKLKISKHINLVIRISIYDVITIISSIVGIVFIINNHISISFIFVLICLISEILLMKKLKSKYNRKLLILEIIKRVLKKFKALFYV